MRGANVIPRGRSGKGIIFTRVDTGQDTDIELIPANDWNFGI